MCRKDNRITKMNILCRKYIKDKYIQSQNEKGYFEEKSKCIIDWFFNRLDNFDNWIKASNKFIIPEHIKRIRVAYACDQSGINYYYICGLIDLFESENSIKIYDWDL